MATQTQAQPSGTGTGQRLLGAALIALGLGGGVLGFILYDRAVGSVDPLSWHRANTAPSLAAVLLGLLALVLGAYLYARGLSRSRNAPAVFLSPEEEERVVKEIEAFEKRTSGELRVHLEPKVNGSILDEAKKTFEALGLTATRERNAVLFFVAVQEHRFAVLGDSGIDQKVPAGFWDSVVGRVSQRFKEAKFADGLIEGIDLAGEALAQHFPPRADDSNELPNQISRG